MADSQYKVSVVSWKELLKGIVTLLLLVAVAGGIIACVLVFAGPGIVSFFSSISMLDTGVVVALIAGLVSIITLVGGGILNNQMKRKEYLYKHREAPYMQLISMFYDFQNRARVGKELTQEELLDVFTEFNKEITLWGSSKAIRKWGNWRVSSARKSMNSNDLLFGMEEILIQLRKDMGLKRGIKKGDLLRLTVNDIDEYIND